MGPMDCVDDVDMSKWDQPEDERSKENGGGKNGGKCCCVVLVELLWIFVGGIL